MTPEALEKYRVLELSREVDDAVDRLWSAGKVSLVLRLLLEDCQRLLGSLRALQGADASELTELCLDCLMLGTPQLDRDLTPAHRELLGRLAAGRRRSVAQLRDAAAQRRRVLLLVGVLGSLTLAGVVIALLRNVTTAYASGTYSSDFLASQAIDGLSKTEWLLPHQQVGWLELRFTRPRDVDALVLRNAMNGHYRDRAAKSVNVEAYSGTQLLTTTKAEFPAIDAAKGPLTVALAVRNVTHVRIAIQSFHGGGGGLAEVEVK
jgi:hypothetical protein